jgi:hypothetical protein
LHPLVHLEQEGGDALGGSLAPEQEHVILRVPTVTLEILCQGAGALRRPVLVALGLRHDGKKEVIDYRLARGESAAERERFLADLYKRGLTGEGLDMICVDGGFLYRKQVRSSSRSSRRHATAAG